MEQRHVENISALIHFMDSLDAPAFTMIRFSHSCGSPACALGWATTMRSMREQGVTMPLLKSFQVSEILRTVSKTFGDGSFHNLFGGNIKVQTPREWANYAREYLRLAGKTVLPVTDGQRDDFTAFMESVLKPVTVTNPIEA